MVAPPPMRPRYQGDLPVYSVELFVPAWVSDANFRRVYADDATRWRSSVMSLGLQQEKRGQVPQMSRMRSISL